MGHFLVVISMAEIAGISIRITPIEGVVEIIRSPFCDGRGRFLNVFRRCDWQEVWGDRPIEQVNVSRSSLPGTVRGLHLQRGEPPEVRLVTCVRGRVWDVVVDLRPDSTTRGHWHAVELDADGSNSLLIPPGCAHGFQVLEPNSELLYLHAAPYLPQNETGVRWDDPILRVAWPLEPRGLSDRDRRLPLLEWV
jgi:dTDP-4-dehydrorhamnose 3,5-epimerase